MEIYWTLKAQDDLERIYRFALQYSRQHADDVLDSSAGLTAHPAMAYSRLGMNLGKSEKCYSMITRFTTNFAIMTSISWISGIPKKNDDAY
jgi:plasmid stabilization system protein ParE